MAAMARSWMPVSSTSGAIVEVIDDSVLERPEWFCRLKYTIELTGLPASAASAHILTVQVRIHQISPNLPLRNPPLGKRGARGGFGLSRQRQIPLKSPFVKGGLFKKLLVWDSSAAKMDF